MEVKAFCKRGKCSIIELHPPAQRFFLPRELLYQAEQVKEQHDLL